MGRAFVVFILAYLGITSSEFSDEANDQWYGTFYEENIVPDIIPLPNYELNVKFPSGVEAKGLQLNPLDIVGQPTIKCPEEIKDLEYTVYTLIFIDPDVPFRESEDSMTLLHWLVLNIPVNNLVNGKKLGGDTAAAFLDSTPPPGTGLHRYLFLLYGQKKNIDDVSLLQGSLGRVNFSLPQFTKHYDLGELVAGNFYLTEIDVSDVKDVLP